MSNSNSHFVVPVKYYVGTFLALLFLTFITVWISRFHFGVLNIYVAMGVAVIKACLVISYFMGMKWESGFTRLILIFTVIFVGIFMAFTLADISTRGSVDPIQEGVHNIQSPVKLNTSESGVKAEHH